MTNRAALHLNDGIVATFTALSFSVERWIHMCFAAAAKLWRLHKWDLQHSCGIRPCRVKLRLPCFALFRPVAYNFRSVPSCPVSRIGIHPCWSDYFQLCAEDSSTSFCARREAQSRSISVGCGVMGRANKGGSSSSVIRPSSPILRCFFFRLRLLRLSQSPCNTSHLASTVSAMLDEKRRDAAHAFAPGRKRTRTVYVPFQTMPPEYRGISHFPVGSNTTNTCKTGPIFSCPSSLLCHSDGCGVVSLAPRVWVLVIGGGHQHTAEL